MGYSKKEEQSELVAEKLWKKESLVKDVKSSNNLNNMKIKRYKWCIFNIRMLLAGF